MAKYIKIKGIKTHYIDKGSGDIVLVLHGWGSCIKEWTKVHNELNERGFRVIALDLPGSGETEDPKRPMRLGDFSEFVHEFTQKINIQYFALLGHSFGGRIAVDYATRWSNQLRALILVSAAAAVQHPRIRTFAYLILSRFLDTILFHPKLKEYRKKLGKAWIIASGQNTHRELSPVMQRSLKLSVSNNLRPYFPNITTPTLLIWGDKDTTVPISDAFLIHKSIPLTHLHILPDLRHNLHLRAPVEIAKNTAYFLNNTPHE
ncbi:MAG: alpha/beta hydrolase [Candidatus Spechtbacterales bacterium]|nr:alpha/beta hydrolase [Candidatus Spechtbacterales bacterium]